MYRFKKGSGLPVRIPVIEMVEIGAGGSERAHEMKGENTRTGTHLQRRWRDAGDGPWPRPFEGR